MTYQTLGPNKRKKDSDPTATVRVRPLCTLNIFAGSIGQRNVFDGHTGLYDRKHSPTIQTQLTRR